MKILVTGATGFLGREIVKLLLENNLEVVCLATKNTFGDFYKNNPKVTFIEADISNAAQIAKISTDLKFDAIVHSAGLAHQFGKVSREKFRLVNVSGTENITKLAVSVNCQRFILISSVAVYGSNSVGKHEISENTECQPTGFYAESKFESENICREICQKNNIPLTILRPSTIVGEGDRGNVLRLIKFIDKGIFVWFGQGNNRKSLIYKQDAAMACFEIIRQSQEFFEILNVTAEPVSMKIIVGEIYRNLNKTERKFGLPEKPFELIFATNQKTFKIGKINKLEETLRKWQSDEIFSGKLFLEKYGFTPRIEIGAAIRRETDWYLAEKCLK